MDNKDSDSSSSDYEVERYVRPDSIKRSINDESADLLGNFDDNKRKEIMEGNYDSPESEEDADKDMIDSMSDASVENGDEENDGKPKKTLTKDQLEVLLRGVSKSSRHVLYVTNLNPETTKEDLYKHFEAAGTVKSVRIPQKRRAFVEFTDMDSYQRGFELHNTDLRGRVIKVQYSEAGKKKSANKKNIIKQKNRKLAQMRNELKTFTKSGKFYDKNIKKEKAVEALARKRWRKKPAIKKG